MERRERVLDLSNEEKEGLKYIGDSIFERMRFEKPTVYIEKIVRRKYVKPNEPEYGVAAPPAPLGIVEGCRYDFSVIAAIVSQKLAFHNPTYRQQDWFSQNGWFPTRSTINHLINLATDTVAPLFEQMWALVIRQPILMTDDTRLLLLTRNALSAEQKETLRNRRQTSQPPDDNQPSELNDRGSVTSYAWLYRGLDGHAPYHVVHWSLGHQNAVVDEHLANFKGVIVADALCRYDTSDVSIVDQMANGLLAPS